MKPFWFLIMALMAAGTPSWAADTPCTLNFPDAAGKVVARGNAYVIRLVDSGLGGVKTAQARFYVYADRQSYWRVITDYDHYPEFMPNIKTATRVGQTDHSDTYTYTLKVALWTVSYTLEMKGLRPDGVWTLSWSYVKGDLKSTSGSWEIVECKEKPGLLLVSYNVRVDVGKLVPAWLSDQLTTDSIPKLIAAVRSRAAGKSTKGGY